MVVNDIGKLVTDSDLLIEAIQNQDQQHERDLSSLMAEDSELRDRIRALNKEAENYVKALGQGKLSVGRLEKAIDRIDGEIQQLKARHQDLQLKIQETGLKRFDHDLIRRNLSCFQETFSTLTGEERAECLQLILRDVILTQDALQLNIWDLPGFQWDSSKKRQDWLLR